ncbi:membrane protein PM19L-like [Dioscorea cayenensis subsp. rotundata]|uniref:Membrane protein PM19L-like n=1 Tax=Dioscorea cayennensis subsp. rotundata TaxID=55577 RepID=A0AB40BRP9_DIOCR|nr:membrane protein PM19L-like [Dioscorea cayenensis subsp. rotundata]
MSSEGTKSLTCFILVINLLMYAIVLALAAWALNYGINETPGAVKGLSVPATIFPIYYPIGNLATGFFVILSLLAGLVGIASSLSGLYNVLEWKPSSLLSAAASSLTAWALTLLAMGFACKEISIGYRPANLRAMETLTIILSGTQLICIGAIHAGLSAANNPVNHGRHFSHVPRRTFQKPPSQQGQSTTTHGLKGFLKFFCPNLV